jgi:hypothetical protein
LTVADLQALRGISATIRETFTVAGTATDLDGGAGVLPAVAATYPDGGAGPVLTATKPAATTGIYQVVLPAEPEVTWLDLSWTGTVGGQPQMLRSRVEWVGENLFNLAAVRAIKVGGDLPFTSTVTFPNDLLLEVHAEILEDFEARTGYSWVPRYTRERHRGGNRSTLTVRAMRPGSLLGVTVDGVAQTPADFDLEDDGQLSWYGGSFPATRPNNVVVSYVRGWDRPPPAITRVALARAAMLLLPSQVGSTVSQWTTPDGTTYSYDPTGRPLGGGSNHYGVPKIAEVLNLSARNATGMAVA